MHPRIHFGIAATHAGVAAPVHAVSDPYAHWPALPQPGRVGLRTTF